MAAHVSFRALTSALSYCAPFASAMPSHLNFVLSLYYCLLNLLFVIIAELRSKPGFIHTTHWDTSLALVSSENVADLDQ